MAKALSQETVFFCPICTYFQVKSCKYVAHTLQNGSNIQQLDADPLICCTRRQPVCQHHTRKTEDETFDADL